MNPIIKPLKLGNRVFPNNLIQGPLAGISTAAFRLLTWEESKPAFTCSEMISCKTILHNSAFTQKRFINKLPNEGPVCYQISGSEINEIAEATQKVTEYGADLINLNCGCPVKKVRSKGAGSKLLANADHLFKIMQAFRATTTIPVSIKIRVDGFSKEKFNDDVIAAINESGIDFLIVHGRHWTEHYETPCNYSEIRYFVDAVRIPVIGNGDIACLKTLQKMAKTGCRGFMIARAGVGQPWLIKKLILEAQQKSFDPPTAKDQYTYFLKHVERLKPLFTDEIHLLQQARKFAKYYARDLAKKEFLVEAINQCLTYEAMLNICKRYFLNEK